MEKSPFHFGLLRVPCLMGVVNVTPDSFSDGGDFLDTTAAVGHGRALAEAGAALVDVGAEASSFFRAGVEAVAPAEQSRRLGEVIPVLARVAGAYVSVDTRSALVARQGISAGASVINDISAGTYDQAMLSVVAELNAAIILMHISPGYPATPGSDDPQIIATVREYLQGRVEAALAAGIAKERIAVDAGVGFGKTMADNWRLALGCGEFREMGVLVVLGASRKRFLETAPPAEVEEEWHCTLERVKAISIEARHPRDAASAAVTVMAVRRGIPIHRVHDVTLAARALTL